MKTKTKSPRKAMETFGRLYCDEDVLATMPEKQKGALTFFNIGKYISDDELEKEYQSRGLIPADPYSLAEYHKKHPMFADEKNFTATHWKDANDKWCFATFGRRDDGRSVDVGRGGNDWNDNWWFAGVRKSLKYSPSSSDSLALPETLTINGIEYRRTSKN